MQQQDDSLLPVQPGRDTLNLFPIPSSNGASLTMKIFVTGASGNIGKVLTKELLSHGHQVLALARSDASVALLQNLGAEIQRGTLNDLDILRKAASECDGVAHLGFIHDFNDYAGCCAVDRAAIEAIGSSLAAAGDHRAFVITSGTSLLKKGQLATEDQTYDENDPFGAFRGPSEPVALAFAERGVRVSVMRLPSVYGEGSLGWVAPMIASAQEKQVVTYIGEGENRWCATHTFDIARAYRLALEKGPAGSVFHAVAEEGVRAKDVALALGRKLNLPVVSKTREEAEEVYGLLANAIGIDNPSSSAKTRSQLGWHPIHPPLLEYLGSGDWMASTDLPSWSHAQDTNV
ncbi:putative oxidoreductase [Hypoxylon argillaceum]|nr:putative oxidoreductase [Hypoxylon argillaceum]